MVLETTSWGSETFQTVLAVLLFAIFPHCHNNNHIIDYYFCMEGATVHSLMKADDEWRVKYDCSLGHKSTKILYHLTPSAGLLSSSLLAMNDWNWNPWVIGLKSFIIQEDIISQSLCFFHQHTNSVLKLLLQIYSKLRCAVLIWTQPTFEEGSKSL